jgi:hypothetical protein
MKVAGVLLIASFLAGCAGEKWVKPGGSVADLNRDHANCQQEARREFPWSGPAQMTTGERQRYREQQRKSEEFYEACMNGQGYTRQRGFAAW